MGRSIAIEPQGDLEGPVEMIEVYYESARAIERLPPEEQYKVIGALCIMIGLLLEAGILKPQRKTSRQRGKNYKGPSPKQAERGRRHLVSVALRWARGELEIRANDRLQTWSPAARLDRVMWLWDHQYISADQAADLLDAPTGSLTTQAADRGGSSSGS